MKYNSSMVAAASGSLGGATFSHNRYGSYIRKRIVPVNPGSSGQVVVRNFFATLAVLWSQTLTQAQRNAWIAYAAAVPISDALGAAINITGANWYTAVNVLRLQASLTRLDAAPTDFTRASLTTPVPTAGATTTSHAFTNAIASDRWANFIGGALAVFQSAPQTASHTFFKGPYRYAGKIVGAVVPPTSPSVINNPYPVVSGQKVYYKYVALNADGRTSSPILVSAVMP